MVRSLEVGGALACLTTGLVHYFLSDIIVDDEILSSIGKP